MVWTVERRLKQSERSILLRPWDYSTGPTTSEGKARSSMNAYKGGVRAKRLELARILKAHRRLLRSI